MKVTVKADFRPSSEGSDKHEQGAETEIFRLLFKNPWQRVKENTNRWQRQDDFKRAFIRSLSYPNFLPLSLSSAEPLPLMDLCRRAARLALGRERLQEIESLPLPQSLKNYLQYQWLIPAEPTGSTGTQTQSSKRWMDRRNDWENQEGRKSAQKAQPLCTKWISEEVERETSTSLFWISSSFFIRLLTRNEWLMMVTPSVSRSSRKKSHPLMAQCGEAVAVFSWTLPPSDENKTLRRGSTHPIPWRPFWHT